MRPQDGKEIWRDTGPLALLREGTYESPKAKVRFARPSLVDQFERLVLNDCIPRDTPLSLNIYGMRTDMKMKVFEWQKETLSPVPGTLVIGSKFADFAQEAIEDADRVEYALKRAIKHLARDDGKGNPKALDSLIANATRQYWSALRPVYCDLLKELAAVRADQRAEAKFLVEDKWRKDVKQAVMRVFDQASDGFDTYGDSIQRQVEARLSLTRALAKLFETPEQEDARKKKSKVRTTNRRRK